MPDAKPSATTADDAAFRREVIAVLREFAQHTLTGGALGRVLERLAALDRGES